LGNSFEGARMIKIYKDETNKRIFDEEKTKRRIQAYREDFSGWGQNFERFPEKMFFVYKEYLRRINHKKFIFFDVGAAEGIYSYVVPDFKTDFSIICFEPENERLQVLIENLEKKQHLGNFQIYQKVVSNETNDLCYLKEWVQKNNSGIAAGSATIINAEDRNPNRQGVFVPYQSVKLDDFIGDFDQIDAIKIDVEGAEIEVLEGARNLIKFFKPIIFLELHTSARFGYCTLRKVKKAIGEVSEEYSFKLINKHGTELEYYLITPKKEER
jgi:FkbM family methyltransferase